MPTRRRRQWVPQAIASFSAQTFRQTELLILQDEGDDLQDLKTSDERIRLFTLHKRWTIGRKRNWLCEQARGEVIIHWDDDDHSAPERIAAQLADIEAHPECGVFGFRSLHFWDTRTQQAWIYEGKPDYALGTSLMYRRSWWLHHKFPKDQVGEDTEFVRIAARAHKLFARPSDGLMVARNHGANTSPKYGGKNWRSVDVSALPREFVR